MATMQAEQVMPPFNTPRTWKALRYRHILFFSVASLLLYAQWSIYTSFIVGLQHQSNKLFNKETGIVLSTLVPGRILGWYSILCALLPLEKARRSSLSARRKYARLIICMVTRGRNIEAINRTARALPELEVIYSHLEFHIVTEEDSISRLQHLKSLAQLHSVPLEFAPRKAKYKARALEWFRQMQAFTPQDWILHIDEETMLDEFAIRSCLEKIETDSEASIAQGVILYNAHHYWKNILTTYADCVRTLDDFGRYQFQFNHARRPVFGMHGAFLLINGEVENKVTWETDNLTEDYWFALQADRLGFRFGWIPAIVREQSPSSLWDFWQQRRRWASGILTVNAHLAVAFVTLWAWQSLEVVLWLSILFVDWPSRIPNWLWFAAFAENSVSLTATGLSLALQDYDAEVPNWCLALHLLFLPIVAPVANLLNSMAAFSAIIVPTGASFHVINK